MIIKSLGRKAGVHGGAGRVFGKLIGYMNRGIEQENGKAVLWHNFGGREGLDEAELQAEFSRNAEFMKSHKRGNVLYHEILSFSAEYLRQGASIEDIERRVTDIGQEYLHLRAKSQLAYGVIHRDTEHLHLHLMISANAFGTPDRVRLSKKAFADVQKQVEAYVIEHHKILGQAPIYSKDRHPERLKTQAHEQAMKSRTGKPSEKEILKSRLHQCFHEAKSPVDLERLLSLAGLKLYTRGQNVGVIEMGSGAGRTDNKDRKHRFTTLGVMEHYQATQNQATQSRGQANTKEQDMGETTGKTKDGGFVWGIRPDTTPEIVASEFATGKLHEAWHGQQEPEQGYTDDILKRVQEQEAKATTKTPPTHPAKAPRERSSRQPPNRENDRGDDLER
jgi:Relaxase/Mobilisation nuclease domain